MAARKNVELTKEHARRVASGSLTLSELATELGISKQGAHYRLRSKGWPTGPTDAGNVAQAASAAPRAPQASTAASRPSTPRRCQRAASARSAAPASSVPPEAAASPEPLQAPPAVEIHSHGEMVEHARRAVAATALAALDRAYEILSKPVGPQGLKAAISAVALAGDQLRRAGFDIATAGEAQAPRMIIQEMTAAEVEATRAEVEAEHRESFGTDDDDDELAEDIDEAGPRQRAA